MKSTNDSAHGVRANNTLKDQNVPAVYTPSKTAGSVSNLLPPFDSQSRNSHLPTPQSPNPLQLNGYVAESQQSPDSRYLTSASPRPWSAYPPNTPQRNILSRSNHYSATLPAGRLVASEPRQKVQPSYSNHAIVTPSPELSRARLPSNDALTTPTPKPPVAAAATGPFTAVEHAYTLPHSPGLSSISQSSPEHQDTTSKRHHPRQRTMSIDEPDTPLLNFNLALARHHAPPSVIQHTKSRQPGPHHHSFEPDDPFIERNDLQEKVGTYGDRAYYSRDEKDFEERGHGARHNHITSQPWSPKTLRKSREQDSYPQYSETPPAESSFSPPSPDHYRYSSSKRPVSPREATHDYHSHLRRNADSPLTPCPVTPPQQLPSSSTRTNVSRTRNDSRSRTPSPIPRFARHPIPEPTTPPPPVRYSRQLTATRTPSPSQNTRPRSIMPESSPSSSPRVSPALDDKPVVTDVNHNYNDNDDQVRNDAGPQRQHQHQYQKHSLPSTDSGAGGSELTRIRALRAQLGAERAAACESHRPDYLVRVDRDKEESGVDMSEGGNVPEPVRVTPVKRRDDNGVESRRKRARFEEEEEEEEEVASAGLGIVETPMRGRRLTLYQPRPLRVVDRVGVEGNSDNNKEESRTSPTAPPFLSLIRPSPGLRSDSYSPLGATRASKLKSPSLVAESSSLSPPPPPPTATPPYALALRSIDWRTPRSGRVSRDEQNHDHSNNGVLVLPEGEQEEPEAKRKIEEERRRLALKERRLAAFRARNPSEKGKHLRPVNFDKRSIGGGGGVGRIIINFVSDDISGLIEDGVIGSPDLKPTQAQLEADPPIHTSSSHPLVPDWPEDLYPWSKASKQRADQAEKERQQRLAHIERYLDRESDSESEEEGLRGVNFMVAYETFGRGSGPGVKKGSEREDGREREQESGVPGSIPKGRKSRGGRATPKKSSQPVSHQSPFSPSLRHTSTSASATKANAFSSVPTPAPPPSSSLMRRLILPTSTADARFALFSRKRVRLLAEKLREKEEEGVVMCICQGGDDGRAMVRCDRCRGWYHLVCVDIRNADELGEEWFCFKCVGDDEEEEEEEEEEGGGRDGEEEEEEEESGVAFVLENRTKTRVLNDIDASNTRPGTKMGTGTGAKSKKQQQESALALSESRRDQQGLSGKGKPSSTNKLTTTGKKRRPVSQKQKQRQQQQQKVPDFAPAMPDSPVRPGVGDQMLYQHHQMFSLQPSPMPPSPRRRTPGGSSSVSPSRRAGGSAAAAASSSGGYGSSSAASSSLTFLTAAGATSTGSFFGNFNSRPIYGHHERSRSRSRSRDRNGYSGLPNDASTTSNNNIINEPSTPRRSISKPFDHSYSSYSYYSAFNGSSSSSSSPSKLGPPLYLTTPKPSYDDAPFDPTSTPSRGLTFSVSGGGPATPISSVRAGIAGSSSSSSGRYSGTGGGSGVGGSNNSNPSTLAHLPPIWATPRTPTHATRDGAGGAGSTGRAFAFHHEQQHDTHHHDSDLYPSSSWGMSGWGDESPVRRSSGSTRRLDTSGSGFAGGTLPPISLHPTPFASMSQQTQASSRRSGGGGLLDSPFVIGHSSSSSSPSSSVPAREPGTGTRSTAIGSSSGSTTSTWN